MRFVRVILIVELAELRRDMERRRLVSEPIAVIGLLITRPNGGVDGLFVHAVGDLGLEQRQSRMTRRIFFNGW
jgi:hypothetical protein